MKHVLTHVKVISHTYASSCTHMQGLTSEVAFIRERERQLMANSCTTPIPKKGTMCKNYIKHNAIIF